MDSSRKFADIITTGGLMVAAVINFLPVPGVIGATVLQRLYGLELKDPNLILLMRHRASLFGVVGATLVAAAYQPAWRPLGYGLGFSSMISYVALAASQGFSSLNGPIKRVFWVDIVGIVALGIAAAAEYAWR